MRDGRMVDLVYIVVGHAIPYNGGGNVIHKLEFQSWLSSLHAPVTSIGTHWELNAWLESRMAGASCQGAILLFIHDREQCPLTSTLAIANTVVNGMRTGDGSRRMVAEIHRPFSAELDVVLNWRFPLLNGPCKMIVLVVGDQFVELDAEAEPSEVGHVYISLFQVNQLMFVQIVHLIASPNCSLVLKNMVDEGGGLIQPAPDEIQLEFLSEEHSIKGLEHNQLYMLVGIIGGMAVVALAISIFWGLNGTSFVSGDKPR